MWRQPIVFKEKPLKEYSRGELAFIILAILAGAVVLAGALVVAPGMGAMVKLFKPQSKAERLKIKRSIQSLQKRGFITDTAGVGYRATQVGVSSLEYDLLSIKKVRWDKKWRLVMFDIPESKRPARIALSRKILDMGMLHIQDSVFVSPYPCEKEIVRAIEYLKVRPYVQIAEAISLSNESSLKTQFGL